MEVDYKFKIMNRYQIIGLVAYTEMKDKKHNSSRQLKLVKALVQHNDSELDTDNLSITNTPKFVLHLHYPNYSLKVIENDDANYTVILNGKDEKLISKIYNNAIKSTLPENTMLTLLHDTLYELSKDEESGGYLLVEYETDKASKYLDNATVKTYLDKCKTWQTEEYLMVAPRHESSAGLLLK